MPTWTKTAVYVLIGVGVAAIAATSASAKSLRERLKKIGREINKGAIAIGDGAEQVGKATGTAAEKAAKAAVAPYKAQYEILTEGKNPVDAVKEVLAAQVGAAAAGVGVAATTETLRNAIIQRLAGQVISPEVENVLADIDAVTTTLGPQLGETMLESVKSFIETGKLEHLDPLVTMTASRIAQERDRLWGLGRSLSEAEFEILPEDAYPAGVFDTVRVLTEAQVAGSLNIPRWAVGHKDRTTAVVLIDTIIFNAIPGTTEQDDKHLWAHELKHVMQYREMGLIKFVRDFLSGSLGFSAPQYLGHPRVELEADIFACKYYNVEQPAYIPRCGWTMP